MKRIFIFQFLFIVISFQSFSQNEQTKVITVPNRAAPSLPRYTLEEKLELMKNATYQLPTTQSVGIGGSPSLSAEANNVARFQDIPVNLFTGTPIVSVPIYSLQEGLLGVPISLDYNASGMKNQEVASWCGAGWNLNAGGQITRVVKGTPDEGYIQGGNNYKGYYRYGFSYSNSPEHDTEPDAFFLTINGSTYRFLYRYYNQEAKFELLGMDDIDIKVNFQLLDGNNTVGKFISFDVTLSDGTHYIFGNGAVETTAEFEVHDLQDGSMYPGTTAFKNYWDDYAQTSVWYLTKIISPYGQEINFDYDHVQYSYYQIGEDGVPSEVCPDPSEVTKTINRVFVKGVSLAKIRGVNTKIEFNQRYKVCQTIFDPSSYENIEVCEYVDQFIPSIRFRQVDTLSSKSVKCKKTNGNFGNG